MTYNKQNYMGEWSFKVPDMLPCPTITGGNVTGIQYTNIRGNTGFFYCYFLMGTKFPFPQYSSSILINRCGFGGGVSCNTANGS